MLTIRRYEPRDAGPTLEVFRAAVRVTARADYSEEQTRAWVSRGARPGWHERRTATETWVAETGDVVVGFVRDHTGTSTDTDTDTPSGAQAVLIGEVAFTNYRLLWRRPLSASGEPSSLRPGPSR